MPQYTRPDSTSKSILESMPWIANDLGADLIAATRAYEANITAINAGKSMFSKSLELGKQEDKK